MLWEILLCSKKLPFDVLNNEIGIGSFRVNRVQCYTLLLQSDIFPVSTDKKGT